MKRAQLCKMHSSIWVWPFFLQTIKTEVAKKTKIPAKAEKIELPKAAVVPVKPAPEVQVTEVSWCHWLSHTWLGHLSCVVDPSSGGSSELQTRTIWWVNHSQSNPLQTHSDCGLFLIKDSSKENEIEISFLITLFKCCELRKKMLFVWIRAYLWGRKSHRQVTSSLLMCPLESSREALVPSEVFAVTPLVLNPLPTSLGADALPLGWCVMIWHDLLTGARPGWTCIPHPHGDLWMWVCWPLSSIFRCHPQHGHQGRGCRWLRQPHALQWIC